MLSTSYIVITYSGKDDTEKYEVEICGGYLSDKVGTVSLSVEQTRQTAINRARKHLKWLLKDLDKLEGEK